MVEVTSGSEKIHSFIMNDWFGLAPIDSNGDAAEVYDGAYFLHFATVHKLK